MAQQVIFVGETYIKDSTFIDENVDVKLLRNVIWDSQEINIRGILGTALYNELKTQITSQTKTALNNTLLEDYIAPALKYWVLHDGALIFTYKIMNKNIVRRTSENTESVQATELHEIMDWFKNRAQYYSERITKYLLENESSYPLYSDAGDGVDTEHPRYNNYTQGLFLGDSYELPKNMDIDCGRNKCR